jgi:hypothetical protein
MTDQHRATPEQISMCVYPGDLATDPRKVAVVINALSDRIEALEAAQLDKLDRLIALDAADPTPDPAMTELRAASAEARPAASEIFPVEYADSNGDGIRIIMEPADETGRVCWVVRNSRRVCPIREFPTPEAAYAAHQAMPAVKDSLTDGGSLVERVAYAMGPQSQAAMDAGELPHGAARAAIREVAAAASQMHASHILRDKNLTWERVAQWLELEASQ